MALKEIAYIKPIKTIAHAPIAKITNTEEIPIRKGNPMAFDKFTVQTVYMPRGNIIPQYWELYFNGIFFMMCRQIPKINISGIHQVPMAQNNKVNPLRKGSNSVKNCHLAARSNRVEPAKTVIASAPMFIQYGGPRSSACILKNMSRYTIRVIIMM